MALLWCCSTLAPPAQDHGSFQMRNCRACGTVFGPKELVPDIKFCTVDSVGHFSPAEHLTQTAAVNLSLVNTQRIGKGMPGLDMLLQSDPNTRSTEERAGWLDCRSLEVGLSCFRTDIGGVFEHAWQARQN